MTIAGCYLSPEGVVLGADSTASTSFDHPGQAGFHYYNYNQKLFEVGDASTLGIITWGLGGLAEISYRTLVAGLNDDLTGNPPKTMAEVAQRWVDLFWGIYSTSPVIAPCRQLAAKAPFGQPPNQQGVRTEAEEAQLADLSRSLVAGFCIGGYLTSDRIPAAFEMIFDPLATQKPGVTAIPMNGFSFNGAPSPIKRLIFGADDNLVSDILASGNWQGTPQELQTIVDQQRWMGPIILPIREAVDFIHACIYSTIKAMKFSHFDQICGGPIEVAVITTDRRFRWVKHKPWNAAVDEV